MDKSDLEKLRHSCAHVMAQAVVELFPGTKLGIGPVIETGFYYDFDSPHHFTPEDLPKIEEKMREIVRGGYEFVRSQMPREEALRHYEPLGESYKLEIIRALPDEEVSFYQHDGFKDLCRGPHVHSTKDIRHFKLLHLAGAYWRGSEKNPMLQRIYGAAFPTKEELEAHLKQLEEAKKRDHRRLGADLELFSVHEEVGAGLVHWHPKGALIRFEIEKFIRSLLDERGYQYVLTPHISSETLYKKSGHLENYSELMYSAMQIENAPYRVKPMNCPNHILIYKSRLHSYRELPVKLAEFGTVYRFERSGVLHGLLRVRGFTQDDAHIFCRPDQIHAEICELLELTRFVLNAFGFSEQTCYLSTRPERFTGEASLWDQAESALKEAIEKAGIPYEIDEGAGAFYGPKLDWIVKDAIGRTWQLSTTQLDFNLPRRFDVTYRSSDGGAQHCVMIHRALLGSLERFMGILIEHYGGAFPLWLAPVQVKVLTLTNDQEDYGRQIVSVLKKEGLRAEADFSPEKLGAKIRTASMEKVPVMAIAGPKEAQSNSLSLRLRGGNTADGVSVERLAQWARENIRSRSLEIKWE